MEVHNVKGRRGAQPAPAGVLPEAGCPCTSAPCACHRAPSGRSIWPRCRGCAVRSLALGTLLALLWLVLIGGGGASSWIVGVPVIAAALVLARRAGAGTPPWRLDPAGALRFVIYFACESVCGGLDVAGRVSARRPRVAPGLIAYRCQLPAGSPARALFVLSASLLPGTLVAAMGERELLIHALDITAPVAGELAELEQRVAGLFAGRLPLPEAAHA